MQDQAKFPFYVLNPFHGMTLPDRVADVCRFRLVSQLEKFTGRSADSEPRYILRTLVSRGTLQCGLLSLCSLVRCAGCVPRIEMLADESISPEEVRAFFQNRGFTVTVYAYDEIAGMVTGENQQLLREFANAFFWGKKMAFTFGLRGNLPILYSDLDVLWKRDPWDIFEMGKLDNIFGIENPTYGYDKAFMQMLSPSDLELIKTERPVCAGVYAKSAHFELSDSVAGYIERQLENGEPGYYFEQSVLALEVVLSGKTLPYSALPTCPKRTVMKTAFKNPATMAVHYAGPTRRQFWRDAMFLQV